VGFGDGFRDGASVRKEIGNLVGPKVEATVGERVGVLDGFNVVVVLGSEVGDKLGCLLGIAELGIAGGAGVGKGVGFADGFPDGTSVGKEIGKFVGFADGTADGIFFGACVGLDFFFKVTSERLGTGDASVISAPVVTEKMDAIIKAHRKMRDALALGSGSNDTMIDED
jgi:hypothetical protein